MHDVWTDKNSKESTKHSNISKRPLPVLPHAPSPSSTLAVTQSPPTKITSQRKLQSLGQHLLGSQANGTDFHRSKSPKGAPAAAHPTGQVDYPYDSLVFNYKCKNSRCFGEGSRVLNTQSEVVLKYLFCGREPAQTDHIHDTQYDVLPDNRPGPADYSHDSKKRSGPPKKNCPFLSG